MRLIPCLSRRRMFIYPHRFFPGKREIKCGEKKYTNGITGPSIAKLPQLIPKLHPVICFAVSDRLIFGLTKSPPKAFI